MGRRCGRDGSIAAIWSAEVVYVESTFGNSLLDDAISQIDIAFALNPTPQRAWRSVSPVRASSHRSAASPSRGYEPRPGAI
jgi:hypothetical protein